MPVLDNPKHERFAQELAKGKGVTEAYVAAGYEESPGSATRLSKKVKERVTELQDRGARRVEVTVASIVTELEEARGLAMDIKQPSAAVTAIMGKAKVGGLLVDKQDVNVQITLGDIVSASITKQSDAA